MKLFKLSVAGLILRFYAMMAVVVIGGFTGQYWLMVLALPIFLSAMMGAATDTQKEEIISKNRTLVKDDQGAKAA